MKISALKWALASLFLLFLMTGCPSLSTMQTVDTGVGNERLRHEGLETESRFKRGHFDSVFR